jgi:hypothetical protein
VEVVDRLQVHRLREQHQVGVAARADEAERAEQVVLGEVGAGRGELALVLRALLRILAAPGRIELQERVLDDVAAGHFQKDSAAVRCDTCGSPSSLRIRGRIPGA